ELIRPKLRQSLRDFQKPRRLVIARVFRDELAEFLDVVCSLERPGAKRMGVGERHLIGQQRAIVHLDLDTSAEAFFFWFVSVVALGPDWILYGADLVPEFHRVEARRARVCVA